MFVRTILGACALASMTACGGGSGTDADPDPAAPTLAGGDWLTWTVSVTPTGSTTTRSWFTDHYPSVAADGSMDLITTQSVDAPLSEVRLTADRQETAYDSLLQQCSNAPQRNDPGAALTATSSWDFSYTRSCLQKSSGVTLVTELRNQGHVVGSETIDTVAGPIDSYKLTYTLTATRSSAVTVSRYTCWRAKGLGVTLRCDGEIATTPTGGTTTTLLYSRVLDGAQVAAWAGSRLAVSRFAGRWDLGYGGSDTGSCTLTVSGSGGLTGDCSSSTSGTSTVAGSVAADGAVSGTLSNGATLAGNLTTPIAAHGTWTAEHH